jgi:hypothetical protein
MVIPDKEVFEGLGLTGAEQLEVHKVVIRPMKNSTGKGRQRMKPIVFSQHAAEQMPDRGATQQEVEAAIRAGERVPAKKGRIAFRRNFSFRREWKGHYYEGKQVMPVVVEENDRMVVVTVYVFYYGGRR